MGDSNPYEPGVAADDSPDDDKDVDKEVSPGVATYNVVSDTVVGLNFRMSDNLFQAIFIFVGVLASAGLGAGVAVAYREPVVVGLIGGAFAGLILGVLASGAVLMVYRAIRHAKGKHD